jgi:hypothetical protein
MLTLIVLRRCSIKVANGRLLICSREPLEMRRAAK